MALLRDASPDKGQAVKSGTSNCPAVGQTRSHLSGIKRGWSQTKTLATRLPRGWHGKGH